MNRGLQQSRRKRCSYRKHGGLRFSGGGYGMGAPLMPFDPKIDTSFAVKMPVNQGFSDCAFPARPGQLFNEPNPALAQAAMAGGKRSRKHRSRKHRSQKHRSRKHRSRKHRSRKHRSQKQRGGCACSIMRGGRTRKHCGGGGGWGVAVDPSVSVGGLGPNAAALHSTVPCDPRAGTMPRSMMGGAHGSGLPTYPAESAAFRFTPSTASGGTMPDGVTPFNEVVGYAGRMGGARSRSNRKNRKSHKHGGGLSEDKITEIINQANCLKEEDKEKVRESLRTLEFNSDPEYISIGCGWRAPRSNLQEQALDKIHCYCKYGDEIA